jgi:hypothetical protein
MSPFPGVVYHITPFQNTVVRWYRFCHTKPGLDSHTMCVHGQLLRGIPPSAGCYVSPVNVYYSSSIPNPKALVEESVI